MIFSVTTKCQEVVCCLFMVALEMKLDHVFVRGCVGKSGIEEDKERN